MNKAKARDFFSDYYEGSLDKGLKQVFERALEADPSLKADYLEFKQLMEGLDDLANVPVPEPAFLSERIQSRIDAKLKEQEKPAGSFWWLSWGRWAFAGAAGLAIVSLLLFNSTNTKGTSTAGLLPWAQKEEQPPRLAAQDGKVEIKALIGEAQIVTVRNATTEKVTDTFKLDAWQGLNAAITNANELSEVFVVEFTSGSPAIRVAMPGSSRKTIESGSGNFDDLAKKIADHFGLPVQIEARAPKKPVIWEMPEDPELDAVTSSLMKQGINLEQRENAILFLSQN